MTKSKLNASIEAIEYIKPKIRIDSIIGVGTGSTVNFFINELAKIRHLFKGWFRKTQTPRCARI